MRSKVWLSFSHVFSRLPLSLTHSLKLHVCIFTLSLSLPLLPLRFPPFLPSHHTPPLLSSHTRQFIPGVRGRAAQVFLISSSNWLSQESGLREGTVHVEKQERLPRSYRTVLWRAGNHRECGRERSYSWLEHCSSICTQSRDSQWRTATTALAGPTQLIVYMQLGRHFSFSLSCVFFLKSKSSAWKWVWKYSLIVTRHPAIYQQLHVPSVAGMYSSIMYYLVYGNCTWLPHPRAPQLSNMRSFLDSVSLSSLYHIGV